MSEHIGLIFSVTAIFLWVLAIRNVRRQRRVSARQRPRQRAPRDPAVNETGPVVYFASDDYGLPSREYRFEYRKVSGNWRAYILKMPALNGRSGAGSITHRLSDGNQRFVCWDKPLRTLEDAQTVSRVWADNIQKYIATGERF